MAFKNLVKILENIMNIRNGDISFDQISKIE